MEDLIRNGNGKEPLKLNKLVNENIIERDYGRSIKPFNQFSPSQVGYCKRQMYNRKMNLTVMPRYVQGILHAGTVNHFWLENNLPSLVKDRSLKTEVRVKGRIKLENNAFDLFVNGFADAVDSEGYVYDHKFTGSTKYVQSEPKDKDKRQVMMYIFCLDDVQSGQLEYVQRDGKFQPDGIVEHEVNFNETEFEDIVFRMSEVALAVKNRLGTEKELDNPFDKCGCYFCKNEELKQKVDSE